MQSSARMLEQLDEMTSNILLIAPDDLSRGLPATLIPKRFADLAARIFARRAHRPGGSISGIVVTGGDGARALVDAFEATGIKLRDEVTTGVPIGTLVGGLGDGLPVVTKAGGFGNQDTLVQAVEAVHAVRDRRAS
jgi:D-threonate/D-erythronate kinase